MRTWHLEEPPSTELPSVSVVVPVYDEADNVTQLVESVCESLAGWDMPWHLILVDDGSRDGTSAQLRLAAARYPQQVSGLILGRNFGQTAAMQAGIDAGSGSIIVTLDGDLQNDARDIPRMVRRLLEEDLDLLVGWRQSRQDNFWLRRLPSRAANRLIGALTGVDLHDYGCSLKVFRAELIREVRLYGDMHRFIPAWMATVTSRDRIAEEPVAHFPRMKGRSKYGLSRTVRVLLDLLSMVFFMRFRARPGHFFGRIGLMLGTAGFGLLAWLAGEKILAGANISARPLLLLGILLAVVGVQFVCTGFVTEMLTRTYFEATRRRPYTVRAVIGDPANGPARSGHEVDDRSGRAYGRNRREHAGNDS
jgi:glycosyltransferase involved in cell wall biosynthesis